MSAAARLPERKSDLTAVLRVTATVAGRRYEEDLATQARIVPNIEGLNQALADNPSRFAEWAMLEELAAAQHDDLVGRLSELDDVVIKEKEAELFLKYQAELQVESVDGRGNTKMRAPTLDSIKATVALTDEMKALRRQRVELERAIREAKAAMKQIAVGRKTMEQKKDSLLASSANWRQEMQTQLQIRAQTFRPGPSRQ